MTTEEFNQIVEEAHSEPIATPTPTEVDIKEYLIDNTAARFSSAEWLETMRKTAIEIAGLGGIGSWTSLLISKLQPATLTVVDRDVIESVNIGGQFYSCNDIGVAKASAISNMLTTFSNYYRTVAKKIDIKDLSYLSGGIAICGFDNMKARKIYFNYFKNHIQHLPLDMRSKLLYIDGRLAAEELQVFAISGDDTYHLDKYEKEYLFSSEEAERTICSYKQTSYCASMIGSIITNIVVNFLTNLNKPIMPRDVPFYTMYNASLMYFKTSNE